MAENNIIVLEDIRRSFPTAAGEFHALKGINAKIPEGSLVILKGRSGSGKTTLLKSIICSLILNFIITSYDDNANH